MKLIILTILYHYNHTGKPKPIMSCKT